MTGSVLCRSSIELFLIGYDSSSEFDVYYVYYVKKNETICKTW